MEENTPEPQIQPGNRNMLIIGLFVVIVLGVLGGIFVMNKSKSVPTPTPAPQVTEATPTPEGAVVEVTQEASPSGGAMSSETAGATKTFNITASSFKFNPATITVKKGDSVTIVLTNSGGNHNLVVDEFNARTKDLPSGATDTITFVANKAGTFEYYCSIGNHRQMGMVGKLIVQ
ncbi:MAG: cupredoxin domain-containing protein [bacterium]|nr:cupredoxin domain-containing protein [bacterium]